MTDAEAAAFVFGEFPPDTAAPLQAERASAQPQGSRKKAIDALMQTANSERQVRITVDLAASQHQALTLLCAQRGKTKAEVIRALIDDFLAEI